jgi:hypothetical protein
VWSVPDGDRLLIQTGLSSGKVKRIHHNPAVRVAQCTARGRLRAQMLGGGSPNPLAGPVWVNAAAELIPSWLDSAQLLPFSQVHGHSSVMDWRRGRAACSADVAAVMSFDPAAAQETATLPGGRIVGIDPGHGRKPHRPWRSFELSGHVSI